MTPSQLAGAVLIQEYQGTDPTAAAERAQTLGLAGSILMGGNIPTDSTGAADLEGVRSAVTALRNANAGRAWGTFISIDQEGSAVARIKAPLTQWPAPMTFGAAGDAALTKDSARRLNAQLRSLGINFNNATVADTTIGAADPTIGVRSYSENPAVAGEMAVASLEGAADAGVLTSVKHFPGHGSVTADSHLGLPVQSATLAQLEARDWKPFQEAIDHGAQIIMMGHIEVPALQANVPSSMSPAAYRRLRSMGYQGVIITDALNMGAITEAYGSDTAAVTALQAGADLLLMPVDVTQSHAAIVAALADGSLSRARVEEAATRVIALGLFEAQALKDTSSPTPAAAANPATAADETASRTATERGATILTGQCSGPLIPGRAVQLVAADDQNGPLFRAAAAKAGITVGTTGPTLALTGYADTAKTADVVVATDGPWPLGDSQAATKVALYSSTPESFDALMRILTGAAKAQGKLTTKVGQHPIGTGCGS